MRELLQKRTTQIIMVLLVLMIWVYNMVQIVSIGTETELVKVGSEMELADAGDFDEIRTPEFTYVGEFRDPFLPEIITRQAPVYPDEQSKELEEAVRPFIKLFGIVEGLAVVQISNTELQFMEAGDSTDGISVHKIFTDSVEFRFNEEFFTLKLE